jgi:hypothetical protein
MGSEDWSPDEALGTEAFEQGDEAADDASRIDPGFVEEMEQDPSRNPALQADERELQEAGAEFDDPERMVTLEGGVDDPDGIGGDVIRSPSRLESDEGWDLDAPLARATDPDDDLDG